MMVNDQMILEEDYDENYQPTELGELEWSLYFYLGGGGGCRESIVFGLIFNYKLLIYTLLMIGLYFEVKSTCIVHKSI